MFRTARSEWGGKEHHHKHPYRLPHSQWRWVLYDMGSGVWAAMLARACRDQCYGCRPGGSRMLCAMLAPLNSSLVAMICIWTNSSPEILLECALPSVAGSVVVEGNDLRDGMKPIHALMGVCPQVSKCIQGQRQCLSPPGPCLDLHWILKVPLMLLSPSHLSRTTSCGSSSQPASTLTFMAA